MIRFLYVQFFCVVEFINDFLDGVMSVFGCIIFFVVDRINVIFDCDDNFVCVFGVFGEVCF